MSLSEIRERIDKIDDQLTALFVERMNLAAEVAEEKKKSGLPVYSPKREREILSKVTSQMPDNIAIYAKSFFTTLFDVSSSYQSRLIGTKSTLKEQIKKAVEEGPKELPKKAIVACQGVEGSYSQQVCDRLFALPSIMYFTSFESVFRAVEQNLCQYGILPIENSIHGSVTQVYDLMHKYNFHIVKSVKQKIHHTLLVNKGAKLEDIKEIYSHEQAIGQCSDFIASLKDVKVNYSANTAMAAKYVAESGRTDIAAISSENCADIYGLEVLSSDIQNSNSNYTRFICISKDLQVLPGADKISLMATTAHRPGSLYRLISKFAVMGINLTKLESRPIPGKDFEFKFYFDMEASVYNDDVLDLLGELSNAPETFSFLGAYSEMS
ncbi:MAG: chorismate mutase [Clostridiales bacterium]|nr:chorismate mutase [Clostridiales bacterium]HOA33931.1 chorismate mutase [Clostridiales bacterium]HOJ35919.1 chorismate mutase [Clostridiales bacterium]HOL79825.1 chorismate mutase [Clostridiales bacterium]HPP69093.1 chorismate mutase [Clostridiales bacterium]